MLSSVVGLKDLPLGDLIQAVWTDSGWLHAELDNWREEKWTHGHRFLTQLNTRPSPLFVFKWLTVKEDEENTSGNRRRYTHLLVRTHTPHIHRTLVETLPGHNPPPLCPQIHIPARLCHWNPVSAVADAVHLILTRLRDYHKKKKRKEDMNRQP